MSTNGRARSEEPSVATSFSELTHDVIELAELQAQLFSLDLKESSQSTRTSLLFAVVSVCLLLGTVPAALIALAETLVREFGWSAPAGFGVATLTGLLVSAGFGAAAWSRFRAGVVTMRRSRDELSRNVAWIKASLRNRAQGTSTGND
ncbi:MAG TPA: phage holin family protein [Lacipirellulaceae bacterium]|nr:phage holin family protein [Lacipirellulaceae bacterium]